MAKGKELRHCKECLPLGLECKQGDKRATMYLDGEEVFSTPIPPPIKGCQVLGGEKTSEEVVRNTREYFELPQ